MTTHISDAHLNDYVDDVLDDATRTHVHAHLAECADCRARADAISTLVHDIDALPGEIMPPRDLRAGIVERLAVTTTPASLPLLRTQRRNRTAALLATAAGLVIISATVTRWWMLHEQRPLTHAAAPNAHAAVIPVSFRNQEASYITQISDVQNALDHERAQLAPETIRILERNMSLIDQAITESRAALDHDPGNRDLGHMVLSAYQQKLELLRRARSFAL